MLLPLDALPHLLEPEKPVQASDVSISQEQPFDDTDDRRSGAPALLGRKITRYTKNLLNLCSRSRAQRRVEEQRCEESSIEESRVLKRAALKRESGIEERAQR